MPAVEGDGRVFFYYFLVVKTDHYFLVVKAANHYATRHLYFQARREGARDRSRSAPPPPAAQRLTRARGNAM